MVFLLDASGSIGESNFREEVNFARMLLSDFNMKPSGTKVSIVTFAGRGQIYRIVDYISKDSGNNQKCRLLNNQLPNINYTGGGTYTHGALMEVIVSIRYYKISFNY